MWRAPSSSTSRKIWQSEVTAANFCSSVNAGQAVRFRAVWAEARVSGPAGLRLLTMSSSARGATSAGIGLSFFQAMARAACNDRNPNVRTAAHITHRVRKPTPHTCIASRKIASARCRVGASGCGVGAGTQFIIKIVVHHGGAAVAAPSRQDRPEDARHRRAVGLEQLVHLDDVAGVLVADLIDQRLFKPPCAVIDIELRDGEFAGETAHGPAPYLTRVRLACGPRIVSRALSAVSASCCYCLDRQHFI